MQKYKIQLTQGGRRQGMTTALLDLAIMNAAAGGYVQFWSSTQARSQHAWRLAMARLVDTLNDTVGVSPGTGLLRWPGGGRIEFRTSERHDAGNRGFRVDHTVYDLDDAGWIEHHGRETK